MPGPFYFAWVDATDTTFGASFYRVDENVFSFKLNQQEGEFAELRVVIKNPNVGLLNSGRHQWCWFSWNDGSTVHPLFFGQLLAIPNDLEGELLELVFLSKPLDYQAQKMDLANTLRVQPYWDPVFISPDALANPDSVLEARTALWHIDRTSLALSISDIISGEDGTINLAGNYFFSSLKMSFAPQQVRRLDMSATVSWRQQAYGIIDISDKFPKPIKSLTGAGLYSSWPMAGTRIGSNWKVFQSDARVEGIVPTSPFYGVGGSPFGSPAYVNQQIYIATQDGQEQIIEAWSINASMQVEYEVNREFREVLRFSLVADVQAIMPDNDPPAPTNSSVPEITGIAQKGNFLYASTGAWTNHPTIFNYQWKRSGVEISGANSNFYVPVEEDVGYPLTVMVTASNAGGFASATSTATANTLEAIGKFQVLVGHLSGAAFDPNATFAQVQPGTFYPYNWYSASQNPPQRQSQMLYELLPPDTGGGSPWAPATQYSAGTIVTAPWQDLPPPYGSVPPVIQNTAPVSKDIMQVSLSGAADAFVDPPDVAGGMPKLPIGKSNSRRFFATDRGKQAVNHLLLQARARLLHAARAADITVQMAFNTTSIGVTLRKNLTLADARIPGGTATGKVKGYVMELDGDKGEATVSATIGCMIGKGNTLSPSGGSNSYSNSGYVQTHYQQLSGAQYAAPTSDVGFADFSDIQPWDDGIDFTTLNGDQAVIWVKVYLDANQQLSLGLGQTQQLEQIISRQGLPVWVAQQDLSELESKLAGLYTTVELRLVDFFPGPIVTPMDIAVTQLMVPKTIDLGAA